MSLNKYTNINILDDTKRFKYLIEYKDNIEFVPTDIHYSINTCNDPLRIDLFTGDERLVRNNNYWNEWNENRHYYDPQQGHEVYLDNLTDYIPAQYNISSVNLYFPQNSVESFTNNNLYALTVNTWIHGHTVYLGTYLIDRRDTIACNKETKFLNSRYFEYINLKFVDPWYLTYSEDWKEFRQKVCGEIEGSVELNNTGSILNFTFYPVVLSEDHYIKLDPYIGGQNAINISDNVDDYIGCGIQLIDDETSGKCVKSNITFNRDYSTYDSSDDEYVQTFEDFKLYMKETYDVDGDLHLTYNLLVVDNSNIYKIVSRDVDELEYIFTNTDINFDNWNGWKEGLRFILNVDIYLNEGEEREDIMLLRSNTVSITQDVMKFFVVDSEMQSLPKVINLESINMNNYIVNAVNKIEKKIIQVEKPNDNKANIIKPVYYRVSDIRDIVIHPAVTENICINLDAYKSTTSIFYLQIENTTFVETARISNGVVFKVVGSNLSGETSSGTYYILNQDKELITTGKYKYEV